MTNYESNDSYESELHLHVSYELMNLVSLSPMWGCALALTAYGHGAGAMHKR